MVDLKYVSTYCLKTLNLFPGIPRFYTALRSKAYYYPVASPPYVHITAILQYKLEGIVVVRFIDRDLFIYRYRKSLI